MNNMYLKANIGTIITVIEAFLILIFFRNVKYIPVIYILLLCYLDIWLFKIAFEYQRITLIVSRIAKLNHSLFSIPELQILMTNSVVSFELLLKSFLSGFVIGYLLLNSLVYLGIFLLIQLLFSGLIPSYIPYKYLFSIISKELNRRDISKAEEYIEKIRLKKYFDELPHTSEYENSAFKKCGNELLRFK